ncbi:hypothetical protein PPERSA_08040 [Pseudocohnilembus persalinus]|uniref:Transmembrane protein n=1 Tax=Pseudocohnilembus persalinus TaxID=266149 RepID=A0A0V0R2J2_PSEPJ|nr:hypothetical protein PPERSA_08040 [Pseudocohnilembus persalinus]|eukprot:KRX08729.1 hypothetical protein PPERSA_08040 [Pseudocohnilembus persalinus]
MTSHRLLLQPLHLFILIVILVQIYRIIKSEDYREDHWYFFFQLVKLQINILFFIAQNSVGFLFDPTFLHLFPNLILFFILKFILFQLIVLLVIICQKRKNLYQIFNFQEYKEQNLCQGWKLNPLHLYSQIHSLLFDLSLFFLLLLCLSQPLFQFSFWALYCEYLNSTYLTISFTDSIIIGKILHIYFYTHCLLY